MKRVTTAMNRNAMIAFAAAGMTLALSACTPPSMGPGEEAFGNAVRHHIALPTVNPEPAPEVGPPPYDGRRAAIAYGRYRTDKVKKPSTLQTSKFSIVETGGGSGSETGSGSGY